MEVKHFENYEKMSVAAAEFIAAKINDKPNIVIGLPTGSTPIGMYKNLTVLHKKGKVDFFDVKTFNLDEYYPIKKTENTSYFKFMYDNFFDHINIKKENVNILNGECIDTEKECEDYESKIKAVGGIDIMVLGIGSNGHIGFNEPDEYLSAQTHKVQLANDTKDKNKRFFPSFDDVPSYALTMGMGTIFMCRSILLLASGEAKKQSFTEMLKGRITTQNPSTFLNLHPNITVLTDINI